MILASLLCNFISALRPVSSSSLFIGKSIAVGVGSSSTEDDEIQPDPLNYGHRSAQEDSVQMFRATLV